MSLLCSGKEDYIVHVDKFRRKYVNTIATTHATTNYSSPYEANKFNPSSNNILVINQKLRRLYETYVYYVNY